MGGKMFQVVIVGMVIFGFSLSGCGWFSDNPMFPTAKIAFESVILDPTGGEAYTGVLGYTVIIKTVERQTAMGTVVELISIPTILRAVRFSFRPLNKVGAVIERCKVEYFTLDGKAVPALTTQINTFISIVPPGTPMAAAYAETQNMAVSEYQTVLELYTVKVEEYMQRNRITSLKVRVTFLGTDYAGHSLSLTTEFLVKAFSGIEGSDIGEIWYACLSQEQLTFGVTIINNAEWVQRVDFFFNGVSAGSRTAAPFVSNPVSIAQNSFPAALHVVVTDLLGNQITKTLNIETNPCSVVPSPSP